MLNTSGSKIHPGDLVSWTFASKGTHKQPRTKAGPRRIALEVTTTHNERVFGRALSFAMAGEVVDILLKQ